MHHNDGLDDFRDQNLRDPLAHASALFKIERSAGEISLAATRIADSAEEQAEAHKERYRDLSDFLLNHGSQVYLPEIARALRNIKTILMIVAALLIIQLFK